MALLAHEMVPNSKITVDGDPGVIVASDAQLVFLARESGKVDLYQTAYVVENGEAFASEEAPSSSGTSSTTKSAPESRSKTTA